MSAPCQLSQHITKSKDDNSTQSGVLRNYATCKVSFPSDFKEAEIMKLKGDIKNIQRAGIGNKKGRFPLGNTPFNLKKNICTIYKCIFTFRGTQIILNTNLTNPRSTPNFSNFQLHRSFRSALVVTLFFFFFISFCPNCDTLSFSSRVWTV